MPGFALELERAEFVHCSGFGCKVQQPIAFSPLQWAEIDALFEASAPTALDEKQQIRRAIALMEQFSGEVAGTARDLGKNYSPDEPRATQHDCIDESTNTLQYLHALEQRQLLRWHRVSGKERRRTFFIFGHWTAVIEELEGKQQFAVDSWYLDNGMPPYIQAMENWRDNDSFSEVLNPELLEL